jgi:hypothetical protein
LKRFENALSGRGAFLCDALQDIAQESKGAADGQLFTE